MLPALPLYTCMNKADKSASNSLNPSIFEGLVTLCAPDAVCFSRHVPHASGRILAERFYVIGTLRSNFLLHKYKKGDMPYGTSPYLRFFLLSNFIRLRNLRCHHYSRCSHFRRPSCNHFRHHCFHPRCQKMSVPVLCHQRRPHQLHS